jgi:hypothetical protein
VDVHVHTLLCLRNVHAVDQVDAHVHTSSTHIHFLDHVDAIDPVGC